LFNGFVFLLTYDFRLGDWSEMCSCVHLIVHHAQ